MGKEFISKCYFCELLYLKKMLNKIMIWGGRLKNSSFLSAMNSIYRNYFKVKRKRFGYIHPTAFYRQPLLVKGIENVYMNERCHILGHSIILTTLAKFVMKKNSGAAEGLTVVTGNHASFVGRWFMDITDNDKKGDVYDKDVIVEEDVWIASNVTLLAGVTVGRGSVIGSGSVLRQSNPPYSIVAGNPAKVVGFKFTPEEIIEHERLLYPKDERLPLSLLTRNYEKYFLNRISEIKSFLKQ